MRFFRLCRVLFTCSLSLGACKSDATSEPPLSDPRGLILLGTAAYPEDFYVMRPDGSGLQQLSWAGAEPKFEMFDFSPVWSPDGTQIAFGSTRATCQTAPWVMDATGTNVSHIGGQATQGFAPLDWGVVPR
ncbi:MAG TPA: hypothetical protein VIR34_19995 [Gemmatimonadaceae bacterium]|jgi:WD40-like Beta Propeller Repeat.